MESVWSITQLVGLAPAQTFETVRSYASDGGIGPRLYDRMIDEVAVVQGSATIITWNIGHMHGLFPTLAAKTPRDYLQVARPADQ